MNELADRKNRPFASGNGAKDGAPSSSCCEEKP
jgi:hypothetical protein